MIKIFVGFVICGGQRIGSWNKPLKQKLFILAIAYAASCPLMLILLDMVEAKSNRLVSAFLLALLVLMTAVFTHLIIFDPDKKINLKFWKRQKPDDE